VAVVAWSYYHISIANNQDYENDDQTRISPLTTGGPSVDQGLKESGHVIGTCINLWGASAVNSSSHLNLAGRPIFLFSSVNEEPTPAFTIAQRV